MAKKLKKIGALLLALVMCVSTLATNAFALDLTSEDVTPGEGWVWEEDTKTLTLNGAAITETVTLPDGATIVVNGDCSIDAGTANAIVGAGALTIKGDGKLTLNGSNGIYATSVSISGINVDFTGTSCGIQVYNATADAKVTLTNVNGSITGGYAGIYVNGECTGAEAAVVVENCDLDVTSTATSWNSRARKAGITVYVSETKKVESSITINNSNVNAAGYDAGLSINNYLNDADATNSASSRINITNSTVVANSIGGTWAGIFASVLGQHPDADSIISITNSSVYAVSPNTGILTSSQKGESGIILDNSILGASGNTALSMIEPSSQKQAAELMNGSTYVQMTPAAVMKGEIVSHNGKTIIATAGAGITYDAENNYYVIPQGSVVTENFTDGTSKEYTFNGQAGGIGGFNYAKEEIWGYDVPYTATCKIVETGVEYDTLTEAVAVANTMTSATIEMLKSIDFEGKKLDIKKNITIIGKYTISRGSYTGTLFNVAKGATLTLDGGLVIDGNNDWVMDKDLYNKHLEEMSQQGISIYTAGMDRTTEIDPYNTQKATQYFTPEEGAPVATGFMISSTNGTVNLLNVTVQNNYSKSSGVVYANGATVNLEGAQIKHCAGTELSGVVVQASNKTKINIKAGTLVDGNHVGGNHGLFKVYSGTVITMSGGTLSNTTGWNSNGVVIGMHGAGSTFNMSGGLITGNSSVFGADNGRNAAVYLHNSSTMNMTGGTISFNNGRARGGIDSYYPNSTLNIHRADQQFVDGVYPNENGADAYNAGNHPMIIDNLSRYENYNYDVGCSSGNYEHWWITGGIYTQDVDEFCAEGYICIPYADTEREDDYIVVPGYRVKYYAVEKVESEKDIIDEAGEVIGTEPVVEYNTTLVHKYFHMLPRDKFWYEMDERANNFELTVEGGEISEWYTEKELENLYDFEGAKLESDLNLYGEVVEIEELPDEDVPLGPTPGGNENIEDEQPPLADVPKTGSMMMLAAMGVMATSGAAAVLFRKKKED